MSSFTFHSNFSTSRILFLHTILHDDILIGGYEFSLTLVLSLSTADFRFLSVLQAENASMVTPSAIIANAINHGGEMTSSNSPLQ